MGARSTTFWGVYTEGVIGDQHDFRLLTLVARPSEGGLPHWHRPSDVVKNVDPDVVARSEGLLWELFHEIDCSRRGWRLILPVRLAGARCRGRTGVEPGDTPGRSSV